MKGLILMPIRKTYSTQCLNPENSKFPMDQQICEFSFHLRTLENFTKIALAKSDKSSNMLKTFPVHIFDYEMLPSKIWQIPSNDVPDHFFSRVTYPIKLIRKWYPYYFYNLFMPQLTISILQLSAFFINIENVDRSVFSCTLFVAHSISRNLLLGYIPQTSQNITLVTSIHIAMLLSMLSTVYFTISYAYRETFFSKSKIDLFVLFLFSFTYFILYTVTIVLLLY